MINWDYLLLAVVCTDVFVLIAFGCCSLSDHIPAKVLLIFAGVMLVGFYALISYLNK